MLEVVKIVQARKRRSMTKKQKVAKQPRTESSRVLVCSGSLIMRPAESNPLKAEIRFNKRISNNLYVPLQIVPDDVAQWLVDALSLGVWWMPREEFLSCKRNAHPVRSYGLPLKRKRENSYRSLVRALDGHFDKSFNDLPPRAKVRVLRDFRPTATDRLGAGWDWLDAAQRKCSAAQWDYDHDPATAPERKFWQDFSNRKNEIKQQVETWKTVAAPTASELAQKETRLAELRKELAAMEQQIHQTGGVLNEDKEPSPDESPTTDASVAQSAKEDIPCAAFCALPNLTADELSIAFVGDKSDSGLGANNLLEISARRLTKRVPLAALNLVNRVQGTLNGEGAVLLGMASTRSPLRNEANSQKIKRLRKIFRENFGITSDPFERYRNGVGWVPLFKIVDRRGAADERAKREAERRTESYEQLPESKGAAGDQLCNGGSDAADTWLKDNDPCASA